MFEKLGANWEIDPAIIKFLYNPEKMGFETLEEFASGVDPDAIMDTIINPSGWSGIILLPS